MISPTQLATLAETSARDLKYQFTRNTENEKLGWMPSANSAEETCPDACPLKGKGCYGRFGPANWNWKKITAGTRGSTWNEFLQQVQALPPGIIWRYGVVGDLPGIGNEIDRKMLEELVAANKGKRGYAYTHKPVIGPQWQANRDAIKWANDNGFRINLSANDAKHADELAKLNIGPVFAILPSKAPATGNKTPLGSRISVCTHTLTGTPCSVCAACTKSKRGIIGNPAHGTKVKWVDQQIEQGWDVRECWVQQQQQYVGHLFETK